MYNPFVVDDVEAVREGELIERSLSGDREALADLVKRHQAWIYNVALRMVALPESAEDVTQEILIKMMTKLSTYDANKASFRTWLYRVVVNHVLNMQKAGYEKSITSLEEYYSFIDKTPDTEITPTPETKMIIEDLGISCTMAVMLCLERQQRLVFILGVVFNVDSEQGGEILGLSSEAFRKALSRAREKLFHFMNNKCGLVNEKAPCHCRNKVSTFIQQGWYKADNLKYYQNNAVQVKERVMERMERFSNTIFADFTQLYREHPFYDPPEMVEWLKDTLARPDFKEIFDLK